MGGQRGARLVARVSCAGEGGDAVMFQYLEMYGRFICSGKAECISAMVVPTPEQQLEAVTGFLQAAADVGGSLDGLEGVFFKLVLLHEQGALDDLVGAVRTYNIAKEVISAIVDVVRDTPYTILDGGINL